MSEKPSLREEIGLWLFFVMPLPREVRDEGIVVWDTLSGEAREMYCGLGDSLIALVDTYRNGEDADGAPTMTPTDPRRLIDGEGVQLPTRCVVDTAVLVELLGIASANDRNTDEESRHLARLANDVESGAIVSLTAEMWAGGSE